MVAAPAPVTGAELRRAWVLVGVGVAVGLLGLLLSDLTATRLVYFLPSGLAVAAITVGVHRNRPPAARAWLLLAGGRTAMFVAGSSWSNRVLGNSAAPDTLVHVTGLLGYALTGWGLVELARHLTRVWDRSRWIDSWVVSLSIGLVATSLLVAPHTDAATGWTRAWLLPIYPAADLLLVLLATRSLLAVRERSTSLRLLTAGLLVQLVGDVARRWVGAAGIAVPDGIMAGSWAVAALLVAAAANHPSVAVTGDRVIPWRRLGAVRFGVLVTSLVLPLLALTLLASTGEARTGLVVYLALGTIVLAALVLVRVSGLVSYADALADERHRSRFEALAENSHDAVVILDPHGDVSWASPAVRAVLGRDPESVVGQPLDAVLGGPTARHLAPALAQVAERPAGTTIEVHAALAVDGRDRTIEGVVTNLLQDAAVAGLVVVVRDVTDRAEMQRQLVEQAFVDPLTGLANRALFGDRVGHALARTHHDGGHRPAVLFVDLDDFKEVNDSLGHGRGDDLLVIVGRRIADAIGPADTAARLGGDEFGVLLEDQDELGVAQVADRILQLLAVPLLVGDYPLSVSASVGVARAGPGTETAAVLLRNADLAMYEAKREGKGQTRWFREELHERELRQFTFRSELQAALSRGQLHLVYQPIVDMDTEAVTGAEALLRWEHPEHGSVSPLEFIPIAEATRAIVPIGRWVLRTACEQLARWTRDAGPLTMDVNVSAVQLLDPEFVGDVAEILRTTGVDPGLVVLELTESILVQDADAALAVLEGLRGLGVRLAIDDFGTGYSSLAYLQNFPIDIVKIDRAFVSQLGEESRGRSLAQSIIAIAGSLGIGTIAEGIETSAQAADLSALDCLHGQGYHYSRPVAPDAFLAHILAPSPAEPADASR